jgi:hypothetical protein
MKNDAVKRRPYVLDPREYGVFQPDIFQTATNFGGVKFWGQKLHGDSIQLRVMNSDSFESIHRLSFAFSNTLMC